MPGLIRPLENVYDQLRRLPGLGGKSALRLAYHVVNMPEDDVRRLAETLLTAKRQIHLCRQCFNLAAGELCDICADAGRDTHTLCVVEQPQDVLALERARSYQGLYHVLHGVLSPLDGIGPDELRLRELVQRVPAAGITEVILALPSNVEGEATATYIAQLLKPLGVTVSGIAHGLPVGSNLEYADEITLTRALENRRPV